MMISPSVCLDENLRRDWVTWNEKLGPVTYHKEHSCSFSFIGLPLPYCFTNIYYSFFCNCLCFWGSSALCVWHILLGFIYVHDMITTKEVAFVFCQLNTFGVNDQHIYMKMFKYYHLQYIWNCFSNCIFRSLLVNSDKEPCIGFKGAYSTTEGI